MADNIDPQITEAVAVGNLKSIAEQPAMLANLAMSNLIANTNLAAQNAVANQQAMNELGVAVLGKAVNLLTTVGPIEARAAEQVLTGDSVAQELADLKAALQAFTAAKA